MDFEGLALRQYTCKPGIRFDSAFDEWLLHVFMNIAMEMVIETMKCFLLNYPDHLRRVFALNGIH